MHIQDIFRRHPTTFSFEFFPPKTDEASQELFATIARLQELKPSFVSVTYGAGGSTRERTHDLVCRIQRETDLTAVSHLTCVCHTREEMEAILDRYAASGIEHVLALSRHLPRDNCRRRMLVDLRTDRSRTTTRTRPPTRTAAGNRAANRRFDAFASGMPTSPASRHPTAARRTERRTITFSFGTRVAGSEAEGEGFEPSVDRKAHNGFE